MILVVKDMIQLFESISWLVTVTAYYSGQIPVAPSKHLERYQKLSPDAV